MPRSDSFPFLCRLCLSAVVGISPAAAQGVVQTRAVVSQVIPKYIPAQDIREEISITGSDSLNDTAMEWGIGFQSFHGQSRVSYTAQLSSTAIQGFLQGALPMVLSDRDMTPQEQAAFQAKNGYMPMRLPLCLDAVIVFVNKGNPINEISLNQLDAIYSHPRPEGTKPAGITWGEIGTQGDWRARNISPYCREEGSTLRSWFQGKVLTKGGSYRSSVQNRMDALGLAEGVVTDPTAIAFSSMDAWYSSVKVIPVAPQEGQKAEPPSQEAIYAGRYPLARSFYLLLNKAPGRPMKPAYQEFAKYLLSSDGQNVIADTGFIPAPPDFVTMGLKRLN